MTGLSTEMNDECLGRWRKRAGLKALDVDVHLKRSTGTTEKYETLGLLRVPCYEIAAMIDLYKVPHNEFYRTVAQATAYLRKLKK